MNEYNILAGAGWAYSRVGGWRSLVTRTHRAARPGGRRARAWRRAAIGYRLG